MKWKRCLNNEVPSEFNFKPSSMFHYIDRLLAKDRIAEALLVWDGALRKARTGLADTRLETIESKKAELALKKLGASEGQILDWKKKAKTIALDDLYKEKLTYQKAISEKQALQAKLKSEADVKLKLEQSLVERNFALKKKEQLVQTLYENERELKSKFTQLNIAQQQSEEYQKNLERLSKKVQLLSAE